MAPADVAPLAHDSHPAVRPPILAIEAFGRRYRRRRPWAVRNLTLSLVEGSITALVGPNGAGKSTLVRACVGLEPPDAGRIVVGGYDTVADRVQAVKMTAYVPQAASLYRSLSIGDHFTMAELARPSFDRELAMERVAAAGLKARQRIGELSGGEQAQVALAIALGTRAPLLLLDEPLASLDPLARRDFLTVLVADVRQRHATVMLSSHIVTDVEQVCDRIALIANGALIVDLSIVDARSQFSAIPEADLGGVEPVAVFAGPTGERLALLRQTGGARPASLEEVVLGHFAAVKRARPQ